MKTEGGVNKSKWFYNKLVFVLNSYYLKDKKN